MTATRPSHDTATDPAASARRTVQTERAGLDAVLDALNADLGTALKDAVACIRAAAGRVIVTGMGKSGHVGQKLAATLASTGTPAFFVHPSEASHGDLGMIEREDVIIALSWSGETAELRSIIEYSRRFRVSLIALTSRADSSLASAADVALVLPTAPEACPHGLAPTTSTVMQLAVGDALAHRAAGGTRLHRARLQGVPPRRPARRQPALRRRHHARPRGPAAGQPGHADGRRDRDHDAEELRLPRRHRRRWTPGRHPHRRRPATSHDGGPAVALCRRGHDPAARRPCRPTCWPPRRWKSSIRARSQPCSCSTRTQGRWASCTFTTCCARASPEPVPLSVG